MDTSAYILLTTVPTSSYASLFSADGLLLPANLGPRLRDFRSRLDPIGAGGEADFLTADDVLGGVRLVYV
jgi:hypothetical protein